MKYNIDNRNSILTKRIHYEPDLDVDIREPFQRDRDRIMHSRAFRRLMHKTQIFNSNIGDHYRNRLTHTLEVSQIARSIGKALNLNDELIEAIALGHDLGHTPYGHTGERALDDILRGKGIDDIADQKDGFKHNLQSLRVVDELETRCTDYKGINLTLAAREGIIKHTGVKSGGKICQESNNDYSEMDLDMPFSFTFEGQVVALSDEIAQYTHDLEDSVRSGIISMDDIIKFPIIKSILQNRNIHDYKSQFPTDPVFNIRTIIIRDYINILINDVIKSSELLIDDYCKKYNPDFNNTRNAVNSLCVVFSKEIEKQAKEVNCELTKKVINSAIISTADYKSEYVIKQLFKAFYRHPKQLPDYILTKYYSKKGSVLNRSDVDDNDLRNDPYFVRIICDHISGMTDQFASREYKRLYIPD